MKFRMLTVLLAVIGISCPSAVLAADNLVCVDSGYTSDDNAVFERYYSELTVDRLGEGLPEPVVEVVTRRISECADIHDWSPDAIEQAQFYRVFSMMRMALERRTPLTAPQMGRLNRVIADADQARLRRVITPIVDAARRGEERTPMGQADQLFLGQMLMRTGVPVTEANGVYMGAYIGAVVSAQQARDRFAAQ